MKNKQMLRDRGEKRGRVVPLESAGVAGKSRSRVLAVALSASLAHPCHYYVFLL